MYNMLNDYFEYELKKKYYIVWYINLDKVYEQEVSLNTFVEATLEEAENNQNLNCIPYHTMIKYFAKTENMKKFIEISKEIYKEISDWQNKELNHFLYINKGYRLRTLDGDIEDIAIDEISPEEIVIHNEDRDRLLDFMKKHLTNAQFEIVYQIIFEGKKQTEIARNRGSSRQAINDNLKYAKKKFKKFKL